MSKELPDIGTSWHGNFKFRKLQIYFPGGRVKGTETQKKDFVPGTQPPIYTIIMYIGGWVPGTESRKKRFCARDPTTNI